MNDGSGFRTARRAGMWPVLALFISGGLLAEVAKGEEGPHAASFRQMVSSQQRLQDVMSEHRPVAPARRLADICRLEVSDGLLSLRSMMPMELSGREYQARVEDVHGDLVLTQLVGMGADHGRVHQFQLRVIQFPEAEAMREVLLSVREGHLELQEITTSPAMRRTVSYRQMQHAGVAGQPRVILSVQAMAHDGRSPGAVQAQAADLLDLQKQHPEHFHRHLLPLLREMHVRGYASASEAAAARLFVDEIEVDPRVTAQAMVLVEQLDAPGQARRQEAMAALEQLGVAGALVLLRMDRDELSPEQNVRLDELLETYLQVSVEDARSRGRDPLFLVECLLLGPPLAEAALRRLAEVTGEEVEFDFSADPEQQQAAVERLRERFIRAAGEEAAGSAGAPDGQPGDIDRNPAQE